MDVPITLPPLWNVPYRQNPFFTGREDILHQLYQDLHIDNAVALAHPRGISGLGGIGKTQTALEYAYRHRNEYDAVLWVRADSIASLISSMIELAQVLHLPERNEKDQEVIVQAVLRWLRLHSGWLLIYDNMDDLRLTERFLPKAGAGHLLFTTRAQAIGGLAQRLDIVQMDPEVGALLLLRRASLLAPQATLNAANLDEQQIAQAISQELDGLPLALDQAGAYIKETSCLLPEYLPRYQSRRGDLLRARGSFEEDYPASVATTWSLSFEKISQANPAAPELLNFCAFLAPDAIPEELLTAGSAHLGEILSPVAVNPLQFDLVCKEVLRFSLMQRGVDESTLTVHRLVQAVLRDNMSDEIQQQWMKRAVPAVTDALPIVEFANWPAFERLVPHALTCATWIEQVPLTTPPASRLLNDTGFYLTHRARYKEAEPLCKRALHIREELLGANHPDTATSMDNLAELYKIQGRFSEATSLCQRALRIREELLGANHPDTATSLNNLALIYVSESHFEEARLLLQRALHIREKQLGAGHPDTATTLDNLAELAKLQGRYNEAEHFFQRASAIHERHLGTSHPRTALSLNNLAVIYHLQGRYSEAEPLLTRALAISEEQLGANHPQVALGLNNLAENYRLQDRDSEAEPLLTRALAISEKQLGTSHANTASILNNLALVYENQGRDSEAEPLFKRALAISEEHLGSSHFQVAGNLNNLATCYGNQGRYSEAESLYKRALAISEEQLGTSHPQTALFLGYLAGLYTTQDRYEEAETLYQRGLKIYEEQQGTFVPNIVIYLNNLANLYETQARYEEAEACYLRGVAVAEKQLELSHPQTTLILSSLVDFYCHMASVCLENDLYLAEAEQMMRRALQFSELLRGGDHPQTEQILKDLLSLLSHMHPEADSKMLIRLFMQGDLDLKPPQA